MRVLAIIPNLNASVDANNFNTLLQHRFFIRMATFLHNIVNIEQAPKILKDQIRMNVNVNMDKLKIFC